MSKYPNLPGFESYIIDNGIPQEVSSTLPKAVVLGAVDGDSFADGTPIMFNEPYVVSDLTATTRLFGGTSQLGKGLSQFIAGSAGNYLPVGVRIGYHTNFDRTAKDETASKTIIVSGDYTGNTNTPVWVSVTAYTAGTELTIGWEQAETKPTSFTTTVTGDPSTMKATIADLGLTIEFPAETAANDVYEINVTPRISSVTATNTNGATMSTLGTYEGLFNGTVTVEVTKACSSPSALDGEVSISYDGGNTYVASGISMSPTVNGVPNDGLVLKDIGLTLSFTAGTTANAVGDKFTFSVYYGRNPANLNETYKAFADAYVALEGYDPEVIIPYGVHMDDAITDVNVAVEDGDIDDVEGITADKLNFAYQLARFAYTASTEFHSCMGFIGVNPPAGYGRKAITTWVNNLVSLEPYATGFFSTDNGTLSGNPLSDEDGNLLDIGRYISVIAGELTITGYSGKQDAAYYTAGQILSLPAEQGPTNLVLQNAMLTYSITLDDANRLAGARITPLYLKRGTGTLVLVGLTGATSASAYTKISTMRVSNELMQELREIGDRYLGKKNSIGQRAAMQREMQSKISAAATLGKIQSGSVQVVSSGTNAILGLVDVYVNVYPWFEIHKITSHLRFDYSQLTSAQQSTK
jgi:hypothetical protein